MAAEQAANQASSEASPTSPRAVLRGNDDTGRNDEHVGTVTWRVEPANAVGAQTEDVRADIEIPDRKFRMTMVVRRNTDASAPPSILVFEMRFRIEPDFGEHVGNVSGVLLKSDEQTRPTPLSGLSFKSGDEEFTFRMADFAGLNDRGRNVQLLRQRPRFEVGLVFTDQHRAIIAIEKGEPGQRAFDKAFAAWGM
jgi:hypothetical protein